MLIGLGIDLCAVPRIENIYARFGARFLHRIYATEEQALIRASVKPCERMAKYFAAKEATSKALGTGFQNGVRAKDIVVRKSTSGQPLIALFGDAARIAQAKVTPHRAASWQIALSLSDEKLADGQMVAVAVAGLVFTHSHCN